MDFPLPLDRVIPKCTVAGVNVDLDKAVPYPCTSCPYGAYEKDNTVFVVKKSRNSPGKAYERPVIIRECRTLEDARKRMKEEYRRERREKRPVIFKYFIWKTPDKICMYGHGGEVISYYITEEKCEDESD